MIKKLVVNNLFVLIDNYINGYKIQLLVLISLMSLLCGIFVIITKNPIISVLFLIGLFLFILMLINIRISELQSDTNNSLPLALIIGIFLYYFLYKVLPFSSLNITDNKFINLMSLNNYSENLYVTSNIWDRILIDVSHIISIGNVIYTNYFIWIIIVSIILLLAMVGTIIITIKS